MLAHIKAILQNERIEEVPQAICAMLNDKTKSCVILINEFSQPITDPFKDLDLRKEFISHNKVVLPLITQGEYIATLAAYKDEPFSTQDINLFEAAACVLSVAMLYARNAKINDQIRCMSIVKSAVGTLSYSELEAVLAVFAEISNKEALVIASKIAEKAKITRSVIVNALRKLESAGIVETRSLGVKGTHIRILNENLLDELKKYRK